MVISKNNQFSICGDSVSISVAHPPSPRQSGASSIRQNRPALNRRPSSIPKAEVSSGSPLLSMAPGPTTVSASSAPLRWIGLLLEKHLSLPGERVSASVDQTVISMVTGESSQLEYRNECGRFVSCLLRPGTVMITPAGPVPDIRLHTRLEMIHCALEGSFIEKTREEMDRLHAWRPSFHAGIQDRSIQSILGMLIDELDAETHSGKLYVESLAHALATRFLLLDHSPTSPAESRVSGLPPRLLNRVREKMEANLDADLSLDSLAEETGYSRAHFLRMFRVATGRTPHQFVLDLRLRRAQNCLRVKNSSMIDIALSCGFSSQSHMTSVFRQRLEMTPGEFRRELRTNPA